MGKIKVEPVHAVRRAVKTYKDPHVTFSHTILAGGSELRHEFAKESTTLAVAEVLKQNIYEYEDFIRHIAMDGSDASRLLERLRGNFRIQFLVANRDVFTQLHLTIQGLLEDFREDVDDFENGIDEELREEY